jgi:HD-GYP domain-containing protein (c-di-GMP phosphodiesterase class II)
MQERKSFHDYLKNAGGSSLPTLTSEQDNTYNTAWAELGLPELREVYPSHHSVHNPQGEHLQKELRNQRRIDLLIRDNNRILHSADDAGFVQKLAKKLGMSESRCASNLRAAAEVYQRMFGSKK